MKHFFRKCLPLAIMLGGISTVGAEAQCRLSFDNNVWKVVAEDQFNASTLNTAFWQTTNTSGDMYDGWGSEWYDGTDPSLVTLPGDGVVHLKSKRWRYPDGSLRELQHGSRLLRYRSGMLRSRHGQGGLMQQDAYGAWEASIKLPTQNAWPTFWLNSCPTDILMLDGLNTDNAGPHPGMLCGVMDNRVEHQDMGACNTDLTEYPGLRPHGGGRVKIWSPYQYSTLLSDGFHKYTVVWTPNEVTFFLDGREIRTVPKSVVTTVGHDKTGNNFFNDIIIALQMWAWSGEDDAEMQVDYVRVLKPKNASGVIDYSLATIGSYKTANEFINHDVSVTGIEPNTQARPGIANLNSAPASIAVNPGNANQVFYRGTDNKLYVSARTGNTWNVSQLPSVTNGDVLGDVTYLPGLNYVVYKGSNNTVQAYYYDGSWQHIWITTTSAPAVSTTAGSIGVRTSDNCIVYVGADNQLHYCYANGAVSNPWQVSTITNTEGGFAYVNGNLTIEQGSGSIFYRGADNRIQYYYRWNGTYYHAFVDANWSTTAYTISGEPKSMAINGSTVYYIGQEDNAVHQFAYNNATSGWDHSFFPASTGNVQAQKAHGGLDVSSDGLRVTYLGYDGRIQGFYQDANGWNHTWLDGYWNTGEFLSFDNTMAGHSSLISTGNLTAYYCGRDNHLRYFTWEPCQRLDSYDDWDIEGNDITLHRNAKAPLATESATGPAQQLTVAPNPTTGRVEVSVPTALGAAPVPYTLTNLLGATVQQGTLSAEHATIDLTACKAGVYLLQTQSGKQTYRTKIVKY
ncbi:T9SS type A sorting domain-containing protein [Hymenobacter chitinivorans]|uniref:Putative secreted protein (Por secretion system target) n=1 Tax=Hymenobacter chitinivorans DSM 11115 TaxID=1121954 RepID=A0A2M9BSC4_9BACT|nr:T9SS type A sorting domain-containing protein [Hymenobacter chitinivorans]PJJ60854.1 putative secreted protein (Por secretion system target) [Hymenobacter chitinivorans DSM 11115]